MPKMVTMVPNPDYKPSTAAEKAAFDKAQPFVVSFIQAMENIQLSKGMYMIQPEAAKTVAPGPRALEDMSSEELKVMLVSLGIKTQKQMKRDDIIGLIRRKLAEIEVDDASE